MVSECLWRLKTKHAQDRVEKEVFKHPQPHSQNSWLVFVFSGVFLCYSGCPLKIFINTKNFEVKHFVEYSICGLGFVFMKGNCVELNLPPQRFLWAAELFPLHALSWWRPRTAHHPRLNQKHLAELWQAAHLEKYRSREAVRHFKLLLLFLCCWQCFYPPG